jgi:creatinine amidohydrolase
MRLQDLNWMDVERYLQGDDRIILITGAAEQHAYLSLLTDILIPERIADAVTQQEHVLVAPPLNFGVSELFVEFPGTISLSRETFDTVLSEMVDGLMHHGFRRFLILNGHGGNSVPDHLTDLQLEGLVRVEWYNWWRSPAVEAFESQHGLELNHANWGENFPFNRVAESPEGEKPPVDDSLLNMENTREVLGDGSFGGPYQVDDDLMASLFDLVVEEAVALLREMPVLR